MIQTVRMDSRFLLRQGNALIGIAFATWWNRHRTLPQSRIWLIGSHHSTWSRSSLGRRRESRPLLQKKCVKCPGNPSGISSQLTGKLEPGYWRRMGGSEDDGYRCVSGPLFPVAGPGNLCDIFATF